MKINIQNHRLIMSVLSMMLLVCIMASMLIVPASAAEIEGEKAMFKEQTLGAQPLIAQAYSLLNPNGTNQTDFTNWFIESYGSTSVMYRIDSNGHFLISQYTLGVYLEILADKDNFTGYTLPASYYVDSSGVKWYDIGLTGVVPSSDELTVEMTQYTTSNSDTSGTDNTEATKTGLSDIVTADLMEGTFDEIIDMLPVIITVLVGYIGLRKALSFIQNTLHSA